MHQITFLAKIILPKAGEFVCKDIFNGTIILFTKLKLFYIVQFFVSVSTPSMF